MGSQLVGPKMKVGGLVLNWTVQKNKAGLSPKVLKNESRRFRDQKSRHPMRSKVGGLPGSKWTVLKSRRIFGRFTLTILDRLLLF